MAVHELPCQKT